ncbi:META domain-containing protein [Defluviicoccus vanus]|uniref:META domain-containing protein n=1 Tax=Defluviicoccus vanus TaxID=111831 RepID=A0A7H1N4R5_9PROT|nr:META domain-containing protein [Defluviicoccus vanus]QNT70701.1 META domain-containing protein [Defluviicoccus vanus]
MTAAACAGPGGASSGGPEPLVGTQWLAQTIAGQEASLYPASSVRFDVGQRITGNGGCNTFNGTIGYAGDQLAVGPLATTRMMCPPEVMRQEAGFLQALQTAQRFTMSDWLLTLFDPSGNQAMTLTRMTGPL